MATVEKIDITPPVEPEFNYELTLSAEEASALMDLVGNVHSGTALAGVFYALTQAGVKSNGRWISENNGAKYLGTLSYKQR